MSSPFITDGQHEASLAQQEILRLQDMITNMGHAIQQLEMNQVPRTTTSFKSPKVNTPDTFKGLRSQVNSFITQLDIYFTLCPHQFTGELDKILFASSFLRDAAFNWFEPQLRQLTQQASGSLQTPSAHTVTTYLGFKAALRVTFGDVDEVATAERQIKGLKQKGSASLYTTDFQRISSHLHWDEAPLMFFYYNGLKEDLKDELSRDDKPKTLMTLMEKAIKIDNRLFERKKEKLQKFGPHQHQQASPGFSSHEPMDLSATTSKFKKSTNPAPHQVQQGVQNKKHTRLTPEERHHRLQNNLCLFCGSAGHIVKECKLARQKHSVSSCCEHYEDFEHSEDECSDLASDDDEEPKN